MLNYLSQELCLKYNFLFKYLEEDEQDWNNAI